MNRITELLDLEDSDIFTSDISIQGTTKFLTLETKLYAHHCPSCGFKMHSRGIKKRIVKHPILQDNYELVLILKQRRWRCTNPECLMISATPLKIRQQTQTNNKCHRYAHCLCIS